MSSLIFYTQPDMAVVATDTLAVDSNGRPAFYTNKAIYIPTLRTIIAGVGVAGFSSRWAEYVSSRMLLAGIENLNDHTQTGLLSLWEDFSNDGAIDPELSTTTVYHIGFSEGTDDIAVFAYRSTNSFVSERLGYGTAVKPDCKVIDGNLMETIPSMMIEQRRLQESGPIKSRIYIGGDIIAIMLTKDECRCFKLGEFPDRDENFREMLHNF